MPSTKVRSEEREKALTRLRELCPPGSTVYTVLRHVSSSGMSRDITPFVIVDGQPYDLEYLMSQVGFKRAPKNKGLRVGGAGMDMGFHLVYSLARTLYPDAWVCPGREVDGVRCPSNDHMNDYQHDFTGEHHSDGGYALSQSWF